MLSAAVRRSEGSPSSNIVLLEIPPPAGENAGLGMTPRIGAESFKTSHYPGLPQPAKHDFFLLVCFSVLYEICPMTLLILLVLAGIPLLGVVWIAVYGSLTTVDGLFMSLILLAMSGILGATALLN